MIELNCNSISIIELKYYQNKFVLQVLLFCYLICHAQNDGVPNLLVYEKHEGEVLKFLVFLPKSWTTEVTKTLIESA